MQATAADGHRGEVQLTDRPPGAPQVGHHHVLPPGNVGGDVEEDGKGKAAEK